MSLKHCILKLVVVLSAAALLPGCSGNSASKPAGSERKSVEEPHLVNPPGLPASGSDSEPINLTPSQQEGSITAASENGEMIRLRYRFVLNDSFSDRLKVKVRATSGPVRFTQTTEVKSQWTVLEVDESRSGRVSRRITSVTAEIETQAGIFVYDSVSGKEPANPLWVNAIGPQIKAMEKQEFSCWVSPLGEIREIQFNGKGTAPAAEELMANAKLVFDPLRDESLRLGNEWVRRETHNVFGQTITEVATIALSSIETQNSRRVAVFDVSTDMEVEPTENAAIKIGYIDSPFKERFVFDLDNGRIISKTASNKRFVEQETNNVRIRQTQEISSEYEVIQ